jgi:alpha-tubulin suppressor-like RCC1 family protein
MTIMKLSLTTPSSRFAAWAAAFAAVIVIAACGGGGGTGVPDPIAGTPAPAGGSDSVPLVVTPTLNVAVSTGGKHTCALQPAGTVLCWGENFDGQLGNGTTTNSLTPVPVTDLSQVVGLSAGFAHTCALQSAGTVRCWGDNSDGQLGNGTKTQSVTSTSVAVIGLNDAKALASGIYHNCAIRASGSVVCWGNGNNLQTAVGNGADLLTPTPVEGLTDAIALSLNGLEGVSDSSCALRAVGTVVCWGSQYDAEIVLVGGVFDSYANISRRVFPTPVAGLSDVRAISAGPTHGCAIVGSGTVKCWGANLFGEIGNGLNDLRDTVITPVTVTGITNAVALSTGEIFSCALLADKTIKCWGRNFLGRLGNNFNGLFQATPVAVLDLSNAVSVSGSSNHACALRTGGALSCWGDNREGQLGDGTTQSKGVPTPVQGGNIFFQ